MNCHFNHFLENVLVLRCPVFIRVNIADIIAKVNKVKLSFGLELPSVSETHHKMGQFVLKVLPTTADVQAHQHAIALRRVFVISSYYQFYHKIVNIFSNDSCKK